ncbi:MAG: DMT family transporter [Rhodospirillum sp.]|nr:DMT family transporter [Rhodospirillum sp.]MCF8491617.1 DMT family transporter [Rhodospirillum sp.]MCF8499526.1 DMT family transporter [Rhodospirillum sp.]
MFWGFVVLGGATVVAQGLLTGGGRIQGGEASLILAVGVVLCGLGYAEGGSLGRSLGGWRVICWALVLALPVTLPWSLWYLVVDGEVLVRANGAALAGLAYVTVFSMLVGFFFWYGGLTLGGIAAVSQIQLLQAFFGLVASALVLGERIDPTMVVASAVLMVSALGARRYAMSR